MNDDRRHTYDRLWRELKREYESNERDLGRAYRVDAMDAAMLSNFERPDAVRLTVEPTHPLEPETMLDERVFDAALTLRWRHNREPDAEHETATTVTASWLRGARRERDDDDREESSDEEWDDEGNDGEDGENDDADACDERELDELERRGANYKETSKGDATRSYPALGASSYYNFFSRFLLLLRGARVRNPDGLYLGKTVNLQVE